MLLPIGSIAWFKVGGAMKGEFYSELLSLWRAHTGACTGLLGGAVMAVCMLVFGFWQTLFVVFMGTVGLWLGHEYDNKADAWLDFKEGLARFLPNRFQRYHGHRGMYYTDFDFRKER